MNTISNFSGTYRFLSNFYPCTIEYEGLVYPSVEHAYQAAKTMSTLSKLRIKNASSARDAKAIGRRVTLRGDWEEMKVNTMRQLLTIKFSNQNLKNQLLKTLPNHLIEGNTWNDTYWGACNGIGNNKLGILLMEIRTNIEKHWTKIE